MFECLPLFLTKLLAYGFNVNALGLIQDYISNRKQRAKRILCLLVRGKNSWNWCPAKLIDTYSVIYILQFILTTIYLMYFMGKDIDEAIQSLEGGSLKLF